GVPVDEKSGGYLLDGGGVQGVSPLRIVVDTTGGQQGFADNFGGRIFGKAEKKESLAGYTYKRFVGNKEGEITVKKVDPMAFENANPEEAFFAVDEDLPSLTGRIDYVDTFISGGTTPSASKVTYHLKANKLTKQQVMNFFKLWLLCVSPTNDE